MASPVNLMVMGPAGYKFGDYWKLGLPLMLFFHRRHLPRSLDLAALSCKEFAFDGRPLKEPLDGPEVGKGGLDLLRNNPLPSSVRRRWFCPLAPLAGHRILSPVRSGISI